MIWGKQKFIISKLFRIVKAKKLPYFSNIVTNVKLTAVVILIYATTVYSSCNKSILGCPVESYHFTIGVKAYPDKDSIHIGDTIWFEVNAPTTLQDDANPSRQLIDYSDAVNLGSAIGFGEYPSIGVAYFAANNFDYDLISGRQVPNPNTAQIREYLFEEKNNRYLFKLGVIPKRKGVFGIGLSNADNVYRKSDKCTKAGFTIIFEDTNSHEYLNPNYSPTSQVGGYYVKVY